MAKKVYRSARGQLIDMDAVQHTNAEVIAVGNMSVNARGDELGPGGKVVKTRNEVMKAHYSKLHTMVPTASDAPLTPDVPEVVPTVLPEIPPEADDLDGGVK